MTLLQAFLYIRSGGGFCESLAFKHQREAIARWRAVLAKDFFSTGLLDVAFTESSNELAGSVGIKPGCLGVSPAARYGVPLLVSMTDVCVELAGARFVTPPDENWRDRLRAIDRDNPFEVAAVASTVVLDVELRRLLLPLRAFNVFRNAQLETVHDVVALGFDGLNGLRNLGEKSIRAFSQCLVGYLESGGTGPDSIPAAATPDSTATASDAEGPRTTSSEALGPEVVTANFREALLTSLSALDPRDAFVLDARLGRDGTARMLDDIGASLGVTRERARQLETRGKNVILHRYLWSRDLRKRLSELLSERSEPLYLDLIAAEDPRFDGFQDNLRWLGGIIEEFGPSDVHVWELEGRLIVSRLSAERWPPLKDAVLQALAGQVETGLTAREVDLMIEAISSGTGAPELAGAVRRQIEPVLHFGTESGHGSYLVAIGRGIKPAIVSIFQDSDRTLHLREVRERLASRGYVVPNATSLRSAIRAAGMLLFGRSVYGTRDHLEMDEETRQELKAELVEIINDDPDHQWHAAELVEELQRLGSAADGIDRYTVGAILDDATEVAYLGRQVWTAKNRRKLTTRDRRDVAQLVDAVLVQAGRPLSKKELREAIERARGLNESFLPQPNDRVIRLGHGRWGLVERDCRLSADETEHAFRVLESILFKRGRALHESEIRGALATRGVNLPYGTEDELIGRAQIDPRFRVARGGYVALPLWQSLGRLTMIEAMEETLEHCEWPSTTEEIQARVESLLDRPVNRGHMTQWLNKAGVVFDPISGQWTKFPDDEDSVAPDEAV